MVLGTSSHVGKSLITAALCRIFRRRGLKVAPFKAQNMSNNAAVCEGGEIGRAQALQARAAGIAPSVHMNPILLKPVGEQRSQVVVAGRVAGTMDVAAYHRFKEQQGRRIVTEHYRALADTVDVVVIEGAGSPVEINLKAHDLANLWVADMADAPVLLVGDIDRGGVLAALVGTIELMAPHERKRVAGFVINKFRGDESLLKPALDYLDARYGVPTLGVIPHIDHHLPEEDGVGVRDRAARAGRCVNVGIVRLPRIANFTDFDPFAVEPDVAVSYVSRPEQARGLDLLILPGSKATIADLHWLRERGLDRAILDHAASGLPLIGICGGYQMLGRRIDDPHGVETGGAADGLGLLDVVTTMAADKRCAAATYTPAGTRLGAAPVSGYEIHMGRSAAASGEALFADAPDGTGVARGNVWGAYLHGLFDNDAARRAVLAPPRALRGLPEPPPVCYADTLEQAIDAFADTVAAHLDLEALHGLV
ncbi:MAG: cobyric acid synthase [Nitrospirae bacterium]|nr:cobyric acid synthase [Nitrospirota bacterium]